MAPRLIVEEFLTTSNALLDLLRAGEQFTEFE